MAMPKALAWLTKIAGLAVAAYLGLCGFVFAQQRNYTFQPPSARLGPPPAGSGYQSLDVNVPGLGVIKDWWAPPASAAIPTIVFFHGNGADRRDFLRQGDHFRQRGWGVVLASYRGYSGNPGAPTEAGVLDDARATVAAVAPRVGPIIIWGHSLGSGVASQLASEGRAAGLVLESPFTSLTDVAARVAPLLPMRLIILDRFDTKSRIERIKVPVLIIHGVDDRVVPFSMGRDLTARLGSRATFVRMEGVGHYPHGEDLSNRVALWAQRSHIGVVTSSCVDAIGIDRCFKASWRCRTWVMGWTPPDGIYVPE